MSSNSLFVDFVSHLRNAANQKVICTVFRYSKLIAEVCVVLAKLGFIESFRIINPSIDDISDRLAGKLAHLNLELAAKNNWKYIFIVFYYRADFRCSLQNLKLISKPSKKVFMKASKISPLRNGLASTILSTSLGVLVDREAHNLNVGGEVLLTVF